MKFRISKQRPGSPPTFWPWRLQYRDEQGREFYERFRTWQDAMYYLETHDLRSLRRLRR